MGMPNHTVFARVSRSVAHFATCPQVAHFEVYCPEAMVQVLQLLDDLPENACAMLLLKDDEGGRLMILWDKAHLPFAEQVFSEPSVVDSFFCLYQNVENARRSVEEGQALTQQLKDTFTQLGQALEHLTETGEQLQQRMPELRKQLDTQKQILATLQQTEKLTEQITSRLQREETPAPVLDALRQQRSNQFAGERRHAFTVIKGGGASE